MGNDGCNDFAVAAAAVSSGTLATCYQTIMISFVILMKEVSRHNNWARKGNADGECFGSAGVLCTAIQKENKGGDHSNRIKCKLESYCSRIIPSNTYATRML